MKGEVIADDEGNILLIQCTRGADTRKDPDSCAYCKKWGLFNCMARPKPPGVNWTRGLKVCNVQLCEDHCVNDRCPDCLNRGY